jgi:3-deoxy-D-manno-octulosonic-acid transferase
MLANVLYLVALALLSPMIVYRMIRHGRYRRGIGEKLFGLSKQRAGELCGNRSCVWIHAVSVGEVNLLPMLVDSLRRTFASQQDADPSDEACQIVISTSTDTGYDIAVKHFGADRVFFCPLDFTWAVQRTLRNLAPVQLVLAELELWPNLIRIAHQQGCQTMVINGRLSKRSAGRYQRFPRFTQPIFAKLSWVGCQDDVCLERFAACGTPMDRLCVTGSMKFDDAPTSRETAGVQTCVQWAGVDPWHRVWIVGSTQPGEELMSLTIYQSLRQEHPELRLILVPRHKQRFSEVAKLVSGAGLKVHRRSRDASLYDQQWDGDTVILVDTIGELRDWWGVGQIATVGGSFGSRGGQNMLEPAGYGSAISFGPDTRNFEEIARRLIQNGGAVRVYDQGELQAFVKRCLVEVPAADSLGRSAREVVLKHRGATRRTVDALCGRKTIRRQAA